MVRSDDPLYSPLLHPGIKFLPPVYIVATTKDPTHQETVFFVEKAKSQGVKVGSGELGGLAAFLLDHAKIEQEQGIHGGVEWEVERDDANGRLGPISQ